MPRNEIFSLADSALPHAPALLSTPPLPPSISNSQSLHSHNPNPPQPPQNKPRRTSTIATQIPPSAVRPLPPRHTHLTIQFFSGKTSGLLAEFLERAMGIEPTSEAWENYTMRWNGGFYWGF